MFKFKFLITYRFEIILELWYTITESFESFNRQYCVV